MSVGADIPIGSELAGYRVEALIGRGGMGVVYRALDLALDRPVALKILAPELAADVSFRERFLRESRLAASIDHPNIVPVYDAGEIAGELYIAMRYVEGSDVKRLLTDGPLPPRRAVAIVAQVAAALDAAHARGLVHRDVKPSNVLVTNEDHAYLADFGLTRRLGEAALAADPARSLGTADYVAPEQIRGDEVDGRADLYSLGCLLYECLTGEPPFRRPSEVATLFAHLEEEPSAPQGLEKVMPKALAKEPDDRFQSGRELVEATRGALGLEPKRSRWPLAVVAVGIALLAAALLAFFLTSGGGGVKAEPGADSLVRIDPSTGKVTRTTPVGRSASGVAADGPYVWVSNLADGTVSRIDQKSGHVRTITVPGSPSGVAAAGGSVAVADAATHKVSLLDAATGTLSNSGTLAGPNVESLVIGASRNGIWYADPGAGIASPVDANLGIGVTPGQVSIPPDRTSFVSAYAAFDGLAVGDRDVWVAGDAFGRSVWRIDPATRRVVGTTRLPFVPGNIAVGEGGVWATSLLDDTISRIDSATGKVTSTIRAGRGVAGIAAGDGAVWVANAFDKTVSRIDPRTNRVSGRIELNGVPQQIAAGPGGVWVTTTRPPAPPPANAIKIGVLADCRGVYSYSYNDALAPAELPLIEHGGRRAGAITDGIDGISIGGHPVKLFFGCADGTTASGLREARRLVEQEHADILIGPLTGDEGLALQDYARRHPGITFVNGASSAQQLHPAPNFFSFWYDGAQWMAGLATYAYKTLGWRTAVTISGADTFDWAQTAGFDAEFCSLGGKIVKRIWFPFRAEDFSSLVPQLPRSGVDGFLLETYGSGATVALATGYLKGSLARRVVQGTTDYASAALARRVRGVLGSSWTTPPRGYLTALKAIFPEIRKDYLGIAYDYGYYDAMAGTLRALDGVHGDLSKGEQRLMTALSQVVLHAPNGLTSLSADHQAVAPSTLIENLADGSSRQVRTVRNVEHTFGGYFKPTDPPPSETTPACVKRTPPPWAR